MAAEKQPPKIATYHIEQSYAWQEQLSPAYQPLGKMVKNVCHNGLGDGFPFWL
jgi:hypothetical protein